MFDNTAQYTLNREQKNIFQNVKPLNLWPLFLALDEQCPGVQVSPHYNRYNPDSPLICMILPTASAFKVLERSIHGDSSTMPYLMVGESSIELMRSLDEHPEKHARNQSSRPVEIVHPDLKRTELAHDRKIQNIMLYKHDWFHCWRNGSNILKPLYAIFDARSLTNWVATNPPPYGA